MIVRHTFSGNAGYVPEKPEARTAKARLSFDGYTLEMHITIDGPSDTDPDREIVVHLAGESFATFFRAGLAL